VQPQPGYRFVRVEGLADRADWMRTPPRLRAAEATLDLVMRASDTYEAVGLIADVTQTRCTDAADIIAVVRGRRRVPGRAELMSVLSDLATGTCSVLEHRFVIDVVRAHGLPDPTRQSPRVVTEDGGRREYRDAEWIEQGLVVELDGRQFHDNAYQRDRDLDRDLDDAVGGRAVVRLGWGQVTVRSCRTAARLALLLHSRGWDGTHLSCPDCQ